MTHYYTNNDNLKSKKHTFDYYFDNEQFNFTTDYGVFSKKNIDYGSYKLIKNIYKLDLGKRVLDLGCGYGVIGIILKRFNPSLSITMVDINDRAINLAKTNIINNKTDIEVLFCDNILNLDNFDSIILNPPIRAGKKVIYDLYHKAYLRLNDGGNLYIVIQKKHGYESTRKELETIFTEVKVLKKDEGYYILKAQK